MADQLSDLFRDWMGEPHPEPFVGQQPGLPHRESLASADIRRAVMRFRTAPPAAFVLGEEAATPAGRAYLAALAVKYAARHKSSDHKSSDTGPAEAGDHSHDLSRWEAEGGRF